jgi:hypothetical protein
MEVENSLIVNRSAKWKTSNQSASQSATVERIRPARGTPVYAKMEPNLTIAARSVQESNTDHFCLDNLKAKTLMLAA